MMDDEGGTRPQSAPLWLVWQLLPIAGVLVGVVLLGVKGWGWAWVIVGLLVCLLSVLLRTTLAKKGADRDTTKDHPGTKSISLLLAVFSVLLMPLVGDVLMLVGGLR